MKSEIRSVADNYYTDSDSDSDIDSTDSEDSEFVEELDRPVADPQLIYIDSDSDEEFNDKEESETEDGVHLILTPFSVNEEEKQLNTSAEDTNSSNVSRDELKTKQF